MSYTWDKLIIPDYDPYKPEPYPGDIRPGYYTKEQVKEMLERYKDNSVALQFLQDMMQ